MSVDNPIGTQIARIREKLAQLTAVDQKLMTFGARQHKFLLNPPLTSRAIDDFQTQYSVELPRGYTEFLQQIGNGGAGPAYGLTALENSIYADMDSPDENNCVDPAQPFPHTEPQIMLDEDGEPDVADEKAFNEKWSDPKHNHGVLRIANLGCGIYTNLIVKGREYGNIWVDDRLSEAGIYPFSASDDLSDRTNFLDWYELWLDQSLNALKKR